MTTTASKMIGHTLTVERIVDVPELVGTVLHKQATTNGFGGPILAFIERRDSAFIACHGTNAQRHDLHPYNDHWTNCRLLAENMAGLAGPYEDLRYVSLTVGETLPVNAAEGPADGKPVISEDGQHLTDEDGLRWERWSSPEDPWTAMACTPGLRFIGWRGAYWTRAEATVDA